MAELLRQVRFSPHERIAPYRPRYFARSRYLSPQVRFSPHEHIVVVGHSLFIRELFRELSHPRYTPGIYRPQVHPRYTDELILYVWFTDETIRTLVAIVLHCTCYGPMRAMVLYSRWLCIDRWIDR